MKPRRVRGRKPQRARGSAALQRSPATKMEEMRATAWTSSLRLFFLFLRSQHLGVGEVVQDFFIHLLFHFSVLSHTVLCPPQPALPCYLSPTPLPSSVSSPLLPSRLGTAGLRPRLCSDSAECSLSVGHRPPSHHFSPLNSPPICLPVRRSAQLNFPAERSLNMHSRNA